MAKTIAIIPARGGSKGLKRKNLKLIDGVPLIGRAVLHAKESKDIDKIFVTTDDQEIADCAVKFGAEVPFLRPAELAEDLTTTEKTLQHALLKYEEFTDIKFDICVFLTPTDIFRNPKWISQSIQILKKNIDIESVFVGTRTHKNFWERNDDGSWIRLREWMSEYSSRQVRRFIVREDTGLACASRSWLWRQGRRIGDKVEIILNDDDFTAIDIHTAEDLELANFAMKIKKKNK